MSVPDRNLPTVWCDFSACGWSGEPTDDACYVFAEPTFSHLPPRENMRLFVFMEEDDTGNEVVGCEATLERYGDGWRAVPDHATWYTGPTWW